MSRLTGFALATSLLSLAGAAWWHWGPAVFVAGLGSLIC